MTTLELEKKVAPLLPKGTNTLERFVKDALLLQLQETGRKIAVFEARYNKNFREFEQDWKAGKKSVRHRYEYESDFLDWEALEAYKKDLMRVIHSL